jgi:hypothetical protein
VFAGTTSSQLLSKLQDHGSDAPRPTSKKKPKAIELEAVEAENLWGSQDAWIDLVSSSIAALASVEATDEVSCRTEACGPLSGGSRRDALLIVLGVVGAFIGLAIVRRVRRGSVDGPTADTY